MSGYNGFGFAGKDAPKPKSGMASMVSSMLGMDLDALVEQVNALVVQIGPMLRAYDQRLTAIETSQARIEARLGIMQSSALIEQTLVKEASDAG